MRSFYNWLAFGVKIVFFKMLIPVYGELLGKIWKIKSKKDCIDILP